MKKGGGAVKLKPLCIIRDELTDAAWEKHLR